MEIIKANEPLLVNNIKMLIYGEPGAGKTSFSFSMESPLCLDFDEGVHRSAFRKDSVKIDKWEDVAKITASDVIGYKTIIVDTVGRQLDKLSASIIRSNYKLGTRAGNLTLQGYGELKSAFMNWTEMIRELGLDLVFIAHSKEEKDGDSTVFRPDIQGGSSGEVFKVSDAVGYMRMINNRRTLDFSPTDKHFGKDTALIKLVEIPSLHDNPSFGADLAKRIKDSINKASESGRKATEKIESYRSRLDQCHDLDCLNNIRKDIAGLSNKLVKDKSKAILIQRMKALNATWSKEKECFISLKVEEPSGPRNLEWYETTAESIDKNIITWWDNEKERAALEDLSAEEYQKMEKMVSHK
jgi:hypothetical protein